MKTSLLPLITLLFLVFSCNKDDDNLTVNTNEDEITDSETIVNPDETSELESDIEFSAEDISFNLANLKWPEVIDANNATVFYNIYLGEELIKENNIDTDYTLTQLDDDTEYTGRIVPVTLGDETGNVSSKVSSSASKLELTPILFSFKTNTFPDPNAPVPTFESATVNSITSNNALLQWSTASISDDSDIIYNVYLEGDLATNDLTSTSYTFENLEPNTEYEGVILAISSNLKSAAVSFQFTTLEDSNVVELIDFEFYRGTSASFPNNSTLQLITLFSPIDANKIDLTWSSSNENVITVNEDQSGLISSHNEGTAIITATSVDNPNITQSIQIEVLEALARFDPSITVFPSRSAVLVGNSISLGINRNLVNVTEDNFIFTSSDPNIATVDASGVAAGISLGIVAITATSTVNPSITYTAMLRVVSEEVATESIVVLRGELERTLYIGDFSDLITTDVRPVDATDQTLLYTSTNTDVISIGSRDRSIRAVGPGEASIIITSAFNTAISETINYTVFENPNSYNENTGVYTALPNSEVIITILGDVYFPEANGTAAWIGDVNISVKNSDGTELLNNTYPRSIEGIGEPQDGIPGIYVPLNTQPIEFTMPSNGEVIIEIGNIYLGNLPEDSSLGSFSFFIDNNIGESLHSFIPFEKIMLF